MLEMNINDADCMEDNFNHETFIDCLRKYCCISKTMNRLLEIQLLTRISLTKCMKEYNKEFIFEPHKFSYQIMNFYDIRKYT